MRSTWYGLAVVLVSMFAMVAANMLYTNYIAEQDAQKWCHLLVTLDEAYQAQPPTSPTGRQVAADTHQLRLDLHCAGKH